MNENTKKNTPIYVKELESLNKKINIKHLESLNKKYPKELESFNKKNTHYTFGGGEGSPTGGGEAKGRRLGGTWRVAGWVEGEELPEVSRIEGWSVVNWTSLAS